MRNLKPFIFTAICLALASLLFVVARISPLKDAWVYWLLALIACLIRNYLGLKLASEYYLASCCLAWLILGFPFCLGYCVIVGTWPFLKYLFEITLPTLLNWREAQTGDNQQSNLKANLSKSSNPSLQPPPPKFATYFKISLLKLQVFIVYSLIGWLLVPYLLGFDLLAVISKQLNTHLLANLGSTLTFSLPLKVVIFAIGIILTTLAFYLADQLLSYTLNYYHKNWHGFLKKKLRLN